MATISFSHSAVISAAVTIFKGVPPLYSFSYKPGYALFSACHLPEKTTVFGMTERTQDIYNADELNAGTIRACSV